MKQLYQLLLKTPHRVTHVPEGYDAWWVAGVLRDAPADTALVWVLETETLAERAVQALKAFLPADIHVLPYPEMDITPYDPMGPDPVRVGVRLNTLVHFVEGQGRRILVASAAALLPKITPPAALQAACRCFQVGGTYTLPESAAFLVSQGFERVQTVYHPGEFALRGSLLDIFPVMADAPVRLDFWGDTLSELHVFDPETQRRGAALDRITLTPLQELSAGTTLFTDIVPPQCLILVAPHVEAAMTQALEGVQKNYEDRLVAAENTDQKTPKVPEFFYATPQDFKGLVSRATEIYPFEAPPSSKPLHDLDARSHPPVKMPLETAQEALRAAKNQGMPIFLSAPTLPGLVRLQKRLEEVPTTARPYVLDLPHGVSAPDLLWLTEGDLDGASRSQRRPMFRGGARRGAAPGEEASFQPGEYVVHQDHGIGRYIGLQPLVVDGTPHDCLLLEYAEAARLYVPIEHMRLLTRYAGEQVDVTLDRLGSAAWQSRKARVKARILEIAEKLITVSAERLLKEVDVLPAEDPAYTEFCAGFPHTETPDQRYAIEAVEYDLASGKIMDRLVCGDVGFGKTEVAMRAAFLVAKHGGQVAVVAPTTLLCRQHYETFRKRFEGFGVPIVQLSRFETVKEKVAAKEALKNGQARIVIGTHSLLAKDIAFQNLQLIIVDEEQHFGVKQKEKLKELSLSAHLLTLSATPIPRTLHMALSGVRELSMITTPPVNRRAVKTFVLDWDDVTLRAALAREQARGGQSFVIVPRLQDLARVQERIQAIAPDARIQVAHGQMTPTDLEAAVLSFYEGTSDILVATNIVESGLDIPRANTLIVWRSDLMGLAQLYQLRGRVGRAEAQGYAYFILPDPALEGPARERLRVLQTLDTLGASVQLAQHDLEMRGAGNLVGEAQSGHIREVGLELYHQMLAEALEMVRLKDAAPRSAPALMARKMPEIRVDLSVMIPEDYIPDLPLRLGLYQRLADVGSLEALGNLEEELVDRFGPLPPATHNLLTIVQLQIICRAGAIEKLDVGARGVLIQFALDAFEDPTALLGWVQGKKTPVRLRPGGQLMVEGAFMPPTHLNDLISLLEEILKLKNVY